MSGDTKIEWTDRTWNPLTGCTKVSPGCDHCYAKTMHERFNGPGSFDTITLHPERLDQPSRWRKPSMVFVNSMSDLFHRDVPDEYIVAVFDAMANAPRHTFQLLTKRHARMKSFVTKYVAGGFGNPSIPGGVGVLPNVWLGVSVESQQWANLRIPALLHTPAAVRFLSCEPLLGPVNLVGQGGELVGAGVYALPDPPDHEDGEPICQDHGAENCPRCRFVDWVIVGGESGQGARPMQLDWARSLRDQCNEARVPFLFKQWGEWAPTKALSVGYLSNPRERHGEPVVDGKHPEIKWRRLYRRVGKKVAGRELDGQTWDEYPERAA